MEHGHTQQLTCAVLKHSQNAPTCVSAKTMRSPGAQQPATEGGIATEAAPARTSAVGARAWQASGMGVPEVGRACSEGQEAAIKAASCLMCRMCRSAWPAIPA